MVNTSSGAPLRGIRVVEFAGIGPAPYACMLLSDLGADVLRIDRKDAGLFPIKDAPVERGRRSLLLDLKDTAALDLCLAIIGKADVLVEGFRPGVMERLGLGPEVALSQNPRIIYGRMTGWGQNGPLASTAGHDITYLALTGVLHAIGPADGVPVPPLNVIGDMGGGGVFLAMGIMAALLERQSSGLGQVVDAAIIDGAVSQLAIILGLRAGGRWDRDRGENLLDGGAPFYRTYRCADGKFISVGALEPKFFAELVQGLGLAVGELAPIQYDRSRWPEMHSTFERVFASRPRDAWAEIFAKTDACAAPVLDFEEAANHPHNAARSTYLRVGGHLHPAPSPRFSRSRTEAHAWTSAGSGGEEALKEWGVTVK